MKFAVIQTGGKQYRVLVGETVAVEKLGVAEGGEVLFDKVLLTNEGEATQVGTPYLAGVKVVGEVLSEKKGKKIVGAKYKAKSNYRVKYGHRQIQTKVKIAAIS